MSLDGPIPHVGGGHVDDYQVTKKRKMVRVQFRDEELNFFKFAKIVLNEFPKALRQIFKFMWNNKFGPPQPWDNSEAVRKSFLAKEGGRTDVPTDKSYEEWDCTALFKATIYAQCFAIHHRTLSDLYVKPRGVPPDSFHTCVVSPSGNNTETFALAIDQLRRLRNFHTHLARNEMDKTTFDQCVQRAKDAFDALGVKTDQINEVGRLTESRFPTNEVVRLEREIRYMRFVLFG